MNQKYVFRTEEGLREMHIKSVWRVYLLIQLSKIRLKLGFSKKIALHFTKDLYKDIHQFMRD